MKEEQRLKEENEKTGKIAGTGAGVVAGAQMGTILLPIPVVGTFTGALVGGVIGSKIGKRFGSALSDKLNVCAEGGSGTRAGADLGQELQKLVKLHEQGLLSDDEFRAAKAKILGI